MSKTQNLHYFELKIVIHFTFLISLLQLSDCDQTEVAQMKKAIAQFTSDEIKFAMIIVKKRIATRLFAKSQNGYFNPRPGTVVDTEITRPRFYDFFLVSQSARQGTVSPVHYNVINNNTSYGPVILQKLTYSLCHLYYNWPVSCCFNGT